MTAEVAVPGAGPYLALVERAIEKGVDADSLEKVVKLVEHLRSLEAEREYHRAMNAAQAEMPVILKTKKGAKAKYAPLEDIVEVINPVYTKHGFSLSFYSGKPDNPSMMRIMCDIMHNGGHSKVVWLDLPIDGEQTKGGMSPVQGHGSSTSYGRRYLTAMIFNLTIAGEDTDAGRSMLVITPEQAAEIEGLIESRGADRQGFLNWAKVSSVSQLPTELYETAVAALKKKKSGGQ